MADLIIGNQLNLSGLKIVALAPGTAGTDAVNKDQLDAATTGGGTSAGSLSTRWEPLANGDPLAPALVFTPEGDVIMVEVAS